MKLKKIYAVGILSLALFATAFVATPPAQATHQIGHAILGGIIGGAIVSESQKNRRAKTRRSTRSTKSRSSKPSISSAQRAENREVQTALNYFSFPAGTPDGVMGRNSRRAISGYQAHLGYASTGQLTQYEKDFLVTSYHRAIAGGQATNQLIAANPQGPRGLLSMFQKEQAGASGTVLAGNTAQSGGQR